MTFLIADDSRSFRQSLMRYILARMPNHHTIYEASDGGEAVALYEQIHPDWVFMDIAMEPMDGLSGSRRILSAHPDARIIILTNYGDAGYRDAAKKAGISAFVLKEHLADLFTILSPPSTRDGS